MGRESGWRIGRLFGIPIVISPSWFFIFTLVSAGLGFGAIPQWQPNLSGAAALALGVGFAALFFTCLVTHELSHALTSRRFNLPVTRIRLFLFGGVSEAQKEMPSPKAEFWIAIVGPLSSVFLGGLCFLLSAGLKQGGSASALVEGFFWLGAANSIIAAFNLLPGFPMDGGRVLRAALWAVTGDFLRATRWASSVGRVFAWALIGVGLFRLLDGGWLGGIWLMALGWLIDQAAQGSYSQVLVSRALDKIRVADMMAPQPLTVPPGLSLQASVEEFFLPHPYHAYPVVDEGRVLGMLGRDDVRAIPREFWPKLRVQDAMQPLADLPAVGPQTGMQEALPLLMNGANGRLPVVEKQQLKGLLSQTDVMRYLLWVADQQAIGPHPEP